MPRWQESPQRRQQVLISTVVLTALLVGIAIGVFLGARSKDTTPISASTTTTAAATTIDRQTVMTACEQNSKPGAAGRCPVLVDTLLGIVTRLGYPCTTTQMTAFVIDDISGRVAADQFTAALKTACGL